MSARMIKNVIATGLIALCSAAAGAEISLDVGRAQASWDQINIGLVGDAQKQAMLARTGK